MNQRVGIDVQADVQGVRQVTNTTAAGVDNIGKAAGRASQRIKEMEKNVLALIERMDKLGKASGRGFGIPGGSSPGGPVPSVSAGPPMLPPTILPPLPRQMPVPPPVQRSTYGYGFARFAHAGLHQGLQGLGQMAGTPGAASVLSGGLRFGLAGASMAGIGAAITGLLQAHGIATQEAHTTDFLKRQLGDIGVNFNTLRDLNRSASAGYGLSSVESASYARQFARRGNLRGMDGLHDELRNAYGFSRAYGMDPSAGVGFFSSMRGVRVTIDETSSKKLGAILAESLEKGGNVAQAQEVMAAVQQFATSMARQTLTMPNVEAFAGGVSSLTRLKLPGLDAQGAGSLLMQADQAMRQGGAKGEASLNVAYAALDKVNPGISAFGAKALMGLGLFGTGKDLTASPWGRMTGFKGGGNVTNFEAVRNMIQKHYGSNPEYLAASMQGFFGLNEQQAAVMAGFSPDQLGGIEALTKRRGIDFGRINSAGMQSLASIAAAKNMGDLVPTIRSVRDRKDIGEADRKALKQALDTGDFGKVQDTLTDILSRADQEMTDGKKSLEVQKQMETALARIGDGLIPATNMIRDGVGRLVNVFAGGSEEANAYLAERKRQKDAADMEDVLKAQVQRGEISPGTADRILNRETGWKGAAVNDALLDAVRQVESGGNRMAVSRAGAKGPYQLMDDTAKRFGVRNPFDEDESRGAARKYLSLLNNRYGGDMKNTLMAYNWGEGNVDAWLKTGRGLKGQEIPLETQRYADKVLRQMGGNVADYDPGASRRRRWQTAAALRRQKGTRVDMAFKTMAPDFRVTLFKSITRRVVTESDGRNVPASERFSGGSRAIDLTPFFGDGSSLETNKSVRQPAGQWVMNVPDQMDAEKMDSLYGLVEPMDVVEIRMRHRPDPAATGMAPPVVMRGFVSNVQRSISMGADGRPARGVTISGADYGKVLEMIQIRYLPNYVIGQNLLTVLRMFVNYGVEAKPNQSGNDFIRQIVDKVINPFIWDMAGFGVSPDTCKLSYFRQIAVEATATNGTISAFGAQSAQGTIWDVLRSFLDVGPWTELFIEDRPDAMDDPERPGGVVLVYRNNPFKDLDPTKGYIMPQRFEPDVLDVGDDSIISLEVSRSDADVANYFQVNMPRMNLLDAATMNLAGQTTNPADFYLEGYVNADPKLYGLRFMEADTQMGGADSLGRVDGQAEGALREGQQKSRLWIDDRRAELMAQNKDNVVFENGSITLMGQCTLRPGMYLRVRHGRDGGDLKQFVWECYVIAVQHRMVPYQGFVTVATFRRGTSFAERIKRSSGQGSPYLAEWNQGGALGWSETAHL